MIKSILWGLAVAISVVVLVLGGEAFMMYHTVYLSPEARLLTAVERNQVAEVEKLINTGVSPNSVDCKLETALILGVYGSHEEIVRFLLEHHADPNIVPFQIN